MTSTDKPDIQYFAQDGTWTKPEGAERVDVLARGGTGITFYTPDGEEGAQEIYSRLMATSFAAAELPDTVEITIGKGGRPGGRDGYALIVTHLTNDEDKWLA